MRIPIPFGQDTLVITVSDNQIGQVLHPRSLPPVADVGIALREAFGSGYCRSFLTEVEEKAGKNRTAVIVVNDYTRPTPLYAVLPPLLDLLNARGLDDARIRIVVALGTHRPMKEEEFRRQAGDEVMDRVGFINPDIDDADQLRFLGTTSSAVDVWVNRWYAEADIRIAVGTILPHGAVGFSGGAKLIVPGISGRKTVESFHVAANSDPDNRAGRLNSPIRAEIEKLIELVGLDLLVNLVVDSSGALCGLTAGHYIHSHRWAVPLAQTLYRLPLASRSRVLLVGSAPADLDFWQAAKGIFNCQAAVEDGGWLVLVTPCPEGIPAEHADFDTFIGLQPEQIEAMLARSAGETRRAGETGTAGRPTGAEEPPLDRITLAPALALSRFRRRIRIAVVSPGLRADQVERMGFRHFTSVEEALSRILRDLPETERRVDIVPHGGVTYAGFDEAVGCSVPAGKQRSSR